MTKYQEKRAKLMLDLMYPILREMEKSPDPLPLAVEFISSLSTTLFKGKVQPAYDFLLDTAEFMKNKTAIKIEPPTTLRGPLGKT